VFFGHLNFKKEKFILAIVSEVSVQVSWLHGFGPEAGQTIMAETVW
jgi:hypothetical protein